MKYVCAMLVALSPVSALAYDVNIVPNPEMKNIMNDVYYQGYMQCLKEGRQSGEWCWQFYQQQLNSHRYTCIPNSSGVNCIE